MPGMDAREPERTETSSGFATSPNFAPTVSPILAIAASTSRVSPAGSFPPALKYSAETSVVIVKPGGTGKPRRAISAKFAPLPPSSAPMLAAPSAEPGANA